MEIADDFRQCGRDNGLVESRQEHRKHERSDDEHDLGMRTIDFIVELVVARRAGFDWLLSARALFSQSGRHQLLS